MDNHKILPYRKALIALALAGTLALLSAIPAQAQQVKLTVPYAKAALISLRAIESDDSTSQENDFETAQTIVAAAQRAAGEREVATTRMLGQIYRLRLRDNDLMRAYGTLIEIDDAQDESATSAVQHMRQSAISQFADVQEAIEKREEKCYRQLEHSLGQRSPEEATACTEWIKQSRISESKLAQD